MNDRQIALIKEVVSLCEADSIQCWLRGGWAMDFFLGRITREHEDIDFFVWAEDAPNLVHALECAGFRGQSGPSPDAQQDFTKDGEEVQIALLAKNQRDEVVVAGGPAAGAPWPEGMLSGPAGRLGDVVCPIVHPRVQIEIKEKFPEWTGRPPSEKHRGDIARLREALEPADDSLILREGISGSASR